MPAKINLLRQRFGRLTVEEETPERKNKSVVWKCRCDCGAEVYLSTKELRSDGVIQCKNCGVDRQPLTGRRESLIGKTFGRLTVIEETDKRRDGNIIYKCQCSCGKITEVCSKELKNGDTKSCGCLRAKYNIGEVINNREILALVGTKEGFAKDNFYYHCKCLLCGREYDALAQTLDHTISCGCQRSIGEYNIIQILIKACVPYQKEYQFPNSLYRFDFAIFGKENQVIRLIEFDGEQHYEENVKGAGWNTYEKYEYTYQNDIKKNNLARDLKIPLVRIPYWERENITIEMILGDKYLVS